MGFSFETQSPENFMSLCDKKKVTFHVIQEDLSDSVYRKLAVLKISPPQLREAGVCCYQWLYKQIALQVTQSLHVEKLF